MPHRVDINVSKDLTNLSIAILQSLDGAVSPYAFQEIPVQKTTGIYYIFNQDDFNRSECKRTAFGAPIVTKDYSVNQDSFLIPDRLGIGTRTNFIEELEADEGLGDLLEADLDLIVRDLVIGSDVEWATRFFQAGVWTTQKTGVVANPGANQFVQWNDYVNSHPIRDMRKGKRDMQSITGLMPNIGIISAEAFDILVDHPDFEDKMPTNVERFVSKELIRRAFELDELYVADLIRNSAREGDPANTDFILGNHMLLLYKPKGRPNKKVAAAGYRFSYDLLTRKAGSAQANGYKGIFIKKIINQDEEYTEIKGEMPFVDKLVSAALGVFFRNVIA